MKKKMEPIRAKEYDGCYFMPIGKSATSCN